MGGEEKEERKEEGGGGGGDAVKDKEWGGKARVEGARKVGMGEERE